MRPEVSAARALVAGLILCAANATALEKWGPTWSEVTGQLYSRVEKNTLPATIKRIDDKQQTSKVVKAEPGMRKITVQSPMRKGFQGTDATVSIELEPCKRYYVNARFESATGTAWQPVLMNVERIPGCKVPAT